MADLSRRAFLKLAAGSSAAAAAGYGVKSLHRIIAHVEPPADSIPGETTLYATTCRECPAGCGLHAWHRDGRVIKVEGNPDHPVNAGGLCARGQSSVQGLYDPDRLRHVLRRSRTAGGAPGPAQKSDWKTAIEEIGERLAAPGSRAYILSDLQTGALAEIMAAFTAAFDGGKPSFTEPFDYGSLRETGRQLFGQPIIPDYRIDEADFVISFGADFLDTWISPVQYAHRFAKMRAHDPARKSRGRMVYVGPRLSATAANADEFIQAKPWDMNRIAAAMLAIILDRGWAKAKLVWGGREVKSFQDFCEAAGARPGETAEALCRIAGVPLERVAKLAEAFAKGGGLALAGPLAGEAEVFPSVSLFAGVLNIVAGQFGRAVDPSRPHALSRLTADVDWPDGSTLFIHAANVGYYKPFLIKKLREKRDTAVVYLGAMPDETAELADWVLPIDSPLESWGDYEPQAGIHSPIQPAMSRMYETRGEGDILLAIAEEAGKPLARAGSSEPAADMRQWLRQRWEEIRSRVAPSAAFDDFWPDTLRKGAVVEPAAAPPARTNVQPNSGARDGRSLVAPKDWPSLDLELWLWASPLLFDGRTANRSWLQEAPDPTTAIQWGSWIDVHSKTAAKYGLADRDVVELYYNDVPGYGIVGPVHITEDIVEGTVAAPFGYGHASFGRVATGLGANVFGQWNPSGTDTFGSVSLRKLGRKERIIIATATQDQHGREAMQWAKLSKLRGMKEGEGDDLALPLPEGYKPGKDLNKARQYKEHRWAMVVDLDRCTGCGACAVACYAENNVAVVGPDECDRYRHMAWLRIVPYRHPEDARRLGFLPMLCQHCDSAPCEPVCPVFASVHSDEGLNAQVYNRCIGTRYCSNNCPYKVRRFNWFDHTWERPLDWQLNPEVTVRCRGVMEKCTFCLQRIRAAELTAQREGRKVRDGEVQPACAQSCPTKAFVFGDLMDGESQVSKLTRRDGRRYHLLEELSTKPAVTYLRRVEADENSGSGE